MLLRVVLRECGATDLGVHAEALSVALVYLGPALQRVGLAHRLTREWVGAHTNRPLYLAGVFAFTSMLAAYAARHARIRYAALLAGLSSLIAWLYVWEKILHRPSANTGRWLLVTAGALLLIVAARLARARAIGASEIATAGGIAAVAAGVFGVIVGGFVAAFRPLLTIIEGPSAVTTTPHHLPARPINLEGMPRAVRTYAASHHGIPPRPLALHRAFPVTPIPHGRGGSALPSLVHVAHTSGLQHFGWDVYLLVVSVALIWAAASSPCDTPLSCSQRNPTV